AREGYQKDLQRLDKAGTALFLSDVVKPGEETSLNTHLPTVRLKGTLENIGCDGRVRVNLENNERLLVENRFHEIIKQNPENYSVQLNIGKLGIPWVDNVKVLTKP